MTTKQYSKEFEQYLKKTPNRVANGLSISDTITRADKITRDKEAQQRMNDWKSLSEPKPPWETFKVMLRLSHYKHTPIRTPEQIRQVWLHKNPVGILHRHAWSTKEEANK